MNAKRTQRERKENNKFNGLYNNIQQPFGTFTSGESFLE